MSFIVFRDTYLSRVHYFDLDVIRQTERVAHKPGTDRDHGFGVHRYFLNIEYRVMPLTPKDAEFVSVILLFVDAGKRQSRKRDGYDGFFMIERHRFFLL